MPDNPEVKTCFIAMPVRTTDSQADLYGDADHWTHIMESLFVPAVEAAGFVPWRPIATGSNLIHAEIVRQLEQADMVLVDMSHSNPNVFFELGVRTSVNRPVALVRCDASVPIPFDVNGVNAHTYDPALRPWNVDDETQALSKHLIEAEASCGGENPLWRQFGLSLRAAEPTTDASPAEARVEVLTQQLTDLSSRVNELVHSRPVAWDSRPPSEWDHKIGDEVSGSSSVSGTVSTILRIAARHKVQVKIYFDPDSGFFVRFEDDPTARTSRKFREEVRSYEELENLSVTFVGPDIDFTDGPWTMTHSSSRSTDGTVRAW